MPIPARRVAPLNLGQSRLLRRLLPLAFLLAAASGHAAAAIITVTTTSDAVSHSPAISLRDAIAQAANGDTITFAVIGSITLKQGPLAVSKSITITGNGGVVIDGNFASQIFNINTGTVSISSLILQGGQNFDRTSPGGAIYNDGSLTITSCTIVSNSDPTNTAGGAIFNDSNGSLTIYNSTFSGNTALATMYGGGEGGAIYDQGVSLSISNSTFSANQVTDPGGIGGAMGGAIYTAGNATITNSTFSGNTQAGTSVFDYGGGAIAVDPSGTLTLSNSTISGNQSYGSGGGGLVNLGSTTINASTFSGNSATGNSFFGGEGGAILNLSMSYTLTVVDSTISGNSVADQYNQGSAGGGGIFNFTGTLSVQNSTISGNSQTGTGSSNLGGGIVNNGGSYGTVTLTNTILAGNTDSGAGFPDGFGPFDPTSTANLIGNGTGMSGISNGSNGNQVGTSGSPINPGLNPLGNYGGPTQTMWPLPGSPAVGAGSTSSTTVATDQRGLPRTVNGRVDIGAVEFQGVTLSSSAGSGQSATIGTAFTNALNATWVETGTLLPLAGAVVTYTAPPSGASATLNSSPTTTNSSGASSVTATANTTAGAYIATASLNGVTANFSLTNLSGSATQLSVSLPGATTAGTPFSVTVTARDQYGNIAPGYRGTVSFTSTDPSASVVLPANYTFTSGDNGVHVFTNGVKLVTAGSRTVTATDTVSGSIKGTSNGIAVSAGSATLFSISGPGATAAGTAFSVTVTALDQYNNAATSYQGTVKFTSTDTNAAVILPANYMFTPGDNGVHTFTNAVKLVTGGSQTVTATDTVSSSIKGTTGVVVSAGVTAQLSVSAPGSATAGTAFSVTVTALDQYNNTATGYRGTVKFTSTDTNTSVVVPGTYTFTSGDNGVHVFTNGVKLVTGGSQTVTATDTSTSSINGTSGTITVSAGAATLLSVSAPGSATAGTAFSVTVTALDQFNNTATGYQGTVKFTSTDINASAVLPGNYTFTSGDNGVHIFTNGVKLVTAGNQTVTATDTSSGSIKGTSSGITVSAGATTQLSVSAPGSATAGTPFSVTVTALDQYSNTTTGYRGTVKFTSTDTNTSVVLPSNYTFTSADNGVHTFTNGVTLVTAASQTVTATDTSSSSIKGTSSGITVGAGSAHLSVSAPGSATAGTAFSVTVTALDQYNNTATSYRGTVSFTSTDTNTSVVLPGNYTFTSSDNGAHTFANSVTLVTSGSQTVTATDTVSSSIKGTSSGITVSAGATTQLSVSAPGSATAGTPFSVTVTALDQYSNTATGYRGTVKFTSTDTNASVVLPGNYTFSSGDNGVHVFTNGATLVTAGSQTVTATDTVSSSIKGTSSGITVSSAAATQLSVSAPGTATAGTPFSVTVTALDQYSNTATGYRGTVKFTSTDTNTSVVLPATYTFTSGDNGVHVFTNGVTLVTATSQTVTATDTSSSSIKGTSSGITVSAGSAHLSVSAPGSATAGTAFSVTVTALDQFSNTATGYQGTVKFTSTDTNASVVLPGNYTFISGDNGVHTFTSGVKLVTSGSQTVTATDTVSSSIKGTSNGIAVSAGPATQLSVSAPFSATTGIAFSVTVTALDQYSNAAASYRGTVKFTSTDASSFVIVPGNYTFTSGDNGVHTFTNGVTLVTVGSQTVTTTDTSISSIKGTSSGITVNPPGYTVQVISVPNGLTGTQMYGINDSGQVAEWGTGTGSPLPETLIASPSASVPIPLPSNSGANGYAINKWGEAAGIFYPSMQGYIGSASGMALIPLPTGSSSVNVSAINDSGQIAGWVPSSGLSYIGTTADSATIPLPGGWTGASAYAINNPGQIAGSLTNGSNNVPFIGTLAGITVVPVSAYWMNPHGNLTAFAINDSGQIAGWGNNSTNKPQAFAGTASGIAPIPLPAGASQAMVNTQCLNNNGSVVGQSDAGGWIWDSINGTRLLNGMVPSGWSITNAISISNAGLILAQGSFNGGVSQYVELVPSGYMTVSYTELNFGLGGGVSTDPQSVTISFAGKPLGWTVSSNQANVTVSPASGSGTGTFQVAASAGPNATLTVTAPGAVNPLQSIAVNVASVTPAAPFGSFDTPSTTGNPVYSGPIGVTGWALDSIEVTGLGIWRAPVTGETPASNGLVFIGNGAFLAGARPDVLADYPTTPLNYRAGWGYQMLTNSLPNSSGSGVPGNGTYVLHAIAADKAGLQTDLGTKTITVDNADSTLPFGTIDTPTQGQTVSGLVTNFGWAVTPSITGCPAADQPCIIPIDGSTIVVYVDGFPTAHPVYNIDRCDVSQSFPNPPYANSGSPNCANNGTSPGPLGFYNLDTTTLSNGVHTIQWSVTDNAGRARGIGARYFTVAN